MLAPGKGDYFEWAVQLGPGELLDIVLRIEARLRRLVRVTLMDARSDWERLIPETVRSELERRRDAASAPSGDLLDFADLGQLVDIVLGRWKQFDEVLADKLKFKVKADEFRAWRNALAHGKDLSKDDKVEIALVLRQVGQQIPVVDEPMTKNDGGAVSGSRVLWVDDHPEWNLFERELLRMLGIDVVPVLGNDEAVELANERSFDLVVSDISRDGEEGGDVLPTRLRAVGVEAPVLFYVGDFDPERGTPAGAAGITNDPALLLRDALIVLSR